jgi:rare lipoprotein A
MPIQRLLCAVCVSVSLTAAPPAAVDALPGTTGIASWYGRWHQGKPMSDGCPFQREAISAAARHWPLGTVLHVTNLDNGRVLHVQVRDRGPYVGNRILDLSEAAATQLDYHDAGLARVSVQALGVAPMPRCSAHPASGAKRVARRRPSHH